MENVRRRENAAISSTAGAVAVAEQAIEVPDDAGERVVLRRLPVSDL